MYRVLIALQAFVLGFEKVLSFINSHRVIFAPRILSVRHFFVHGYFEVSHLENPNPRYSCSDQGQMLFLT